jgi:hypothetical protein
MHDDSAGAGRFCWRELATSDLEQSIRFYTRLFPWSVHDPGSGEKSAVFTLGDREIGGIRRLDPGRGNGSRWHSCVLVKDVRAAVERACRLGGRVETPPGEEPRTGWTALITDPAGAAIAPVQREPERRGGDSIPGPGVVCWNELMTHDPIGVARFYSEVFGWTVVEEETGSSGKYWLYKNGDSHAGGMTAVPPAPALPGAARPGGQWLAYILVENVDASSEAAVSLGATILVGPADIPHVGRYSVIRDPGRATLGLFQMK